MEKTKEDLIELRNHGFSSRAIAKLVNVELGKLRSDKRLSGERIRQLIGWVDGKPGTPEINRKAIANVAKRLRG